MDQKIILGRFNQEEKIILDIVNRFNEALTESDIDKYFSFIDENFTTFVSSSPYRIDGIFDDKEELVNMYKTRRFVIFEEMQPLVQTFGECAVVTYHVRAVLESNGEKITIYLKETDVLIRKDETWKVVHVHISGTK